MNAICLVVDRLHLGYLGCYGNTWVVTPEMNRLAAESFVFDQALVESPNMADLYDAWWRGQSIWRPAATAPPMALPTALQQRGIATTLVADDPLNNLPWLSDEVAERIVLPSAATAASADDIDETHLAGFFAAAADALDAQRDPFLLWLHTGSLGQCWDAPLAMRRSFAAEDEPEPPSGVAAPQLVLPSNYDPDELLGVCQSYAAQMALLDACLGAFLEFFRSSRFAADTALVLIGARGLALGEHRRIGAWDEALCGETLRTPLVMRMPDGCGRLARSSALVQPADLHDTLVEWFGVPVEREHGSRSQCLLPIVRDEPTALRDRLAMRSASGERAIRTARWYMRVAGSAPQPGDETPSAGFEPDAAARRCWLYAQPDDRWEINDVADRCRAQVESLQAVLDECAAPEMSAPAPLPSLLTDRQA